ncbi:uncharacterized protein LOC117141623 isoform X2 [Drosophila mauritiana]|uniref:Uncharacterized protein LOC117141623 isoform X2 n=1 Tax=Drosophila mauritiana TaxID=7226 RepID=A0A6P8K9Z3_DROMA|nr:uncharacterized protein LOC117141623 isoform X2 [Drosophila mauritiana]
MFKPHYHLAAVLLCFVFTTAQVVPNAEIGRITIQVPLLSNGKPVILTNQEREEVATVEEIKPGKVHVVQEVVVPPTVKSDNKSYHQRTRIYINAQASTQQELFPSSDGWHDHHVASGYDDTSIYGKLR